MLLRSLRGKQCPEHFANFFGDKLLVTSLADNSMNVLSVSAQEKRNRRLVYANLNRLQEILRDVGANPKDMYVEIAEEGANVAVSHRLLPVVEDTLLNLNALQRTPWMLSQDMLTDLVAKHMAAGEFATNHRVVDMRNFL